MGTTRCVRVNVVSTEKRPYGNSKQSKSGREVPVSFPSATKRAKVNWRPFVTNAVSRCKVVALFEVFKTK